MEINNTDYILDEHNYVREETEKEKIIFMNSLNEGMNHVNGWKTRMNGEYKYTSAFTIAKDGTVFQHYDPKYWSKVFNKNIDREIIPITMENYGYLKMENKETGFITWLRDIYKGDEVFEKRWRGYKYWDPYTDEQKESAVRLVDELCETFDIEKDSVPYNIKIDSPEAFKGVMYRSNFDKYYCDLSPAWDFTLFTIKEKV